MPSISVKNLTVKYGKKNPIVAVDDLSVEFLNNKVNIIIGKSGSGKTSLLRAILGLEDYDGDIYFDDENIRGLSQKDKNIGYVNQNIALYPSHNLFNNIANPLTNSVASGEEIRQRVFEVAKLLNIEDCLMRKPSEISIGQGQRAAIARAIVKKPNLYIFDEAFSNLDVKSRDSIRTDLLRIFNSINSTVIMVTHDIKEALLFGDYIYVMDEGKLIDQGDKKEILKSKNKTTLELFKEYEK